MSDDIYLSDNENSSIINNDSLIIFSEEEIDSEYEQEENEYKRLINEKIVNKINNMNLEERIKKNTSKSKDKPNEEVKKIKKQRIKNFLDLTQKTKDDNKPKKWKSKRMEDKKEPEYVPRKFNPRFPPLGKKF